jgi:hypothetical protein
MHENPNLKVTEAASIMGREWRSMNDSQKLKYMKK